MRRWATAGSRGVLTAIVFTLLAGGVLAWVGFRALLERERTARTHYTSTALLVRDRLGAELDRLERELGSEFARAAPALHAAPAARRWLTRLAADRPWLVDPILVDDAGGVLSMDVQAGWVAGETASASPQFASLLAQAERSEFVSGNLEDALRVYRRAFARSPSATDRVANHMRVGRVLFKLGRRAEGVDEYRNAIRLAGDLTDSFGVPYAVGALCQVAEGLAELGRRSEQHVAARDLQNYVVAHPWSADAGYEYYLAYALSLLDDHAPAIDAGVRRLRGRLVWLGWIRQAVTPAVVADLRSSRAEITVERAVVPRGNDRAVVSWITAPVKEAPALGLAYELPVAYVTGTMLEDVLATVDVGRDLYITAREDAAGNVRESGVAPVPLAQADLLGFPGWRIGLFDRTGRSQQQLAFRERLIYGTLIGGMILVLVSGIAFTARASAHESRLARLRTEFVASVSHELKTPLALIRMFGETLDSGIVTDDEQRREFYGVIRRESERLTHLIENVLDIARIEAGTKQYSFERADISALARDALEAYRPFLERQGFEIQLALSAGPCIIRVDRDAVVRALINLFQNATKYSEENRHLTISSAIDGGEYHLSVADRGIGIGAADLPRIFDRYYRAQPERASSSAGSGLGLSLVAHAMAAHGGRVDVESKPGEGSVFTLVFPVGAGPGERKHDEDPHR